MDILKAFQKLNVKKGDSVFLSTSLGMLGMPDTKNKNLLKNNPRLSMQVKNWDNKEKKIQNEIIERSKKIFSNIELY